MKSAFCGVCVSAGHTSVDCPHGQRAYRERQPQMKPPVWMHITGISVEEKTLVLHVTIRWWHPALWFSLIRYWHEAYRERREA